MSNEAAPTFRFRHGRWTVLAAFALAVLSTHAAHGGVWTSNGPRGGIVRSLAVDPTTPSTVYAGTSSGGVFKSTNGGSSWTFSTAGIQSTGDFIITGLAVDPATPSRVYATATNAADGGVFRSTDGGASWTFAPVGYSTAIAIDPATPTTLYAAGASHIRKSIDAGVTWTPLQLSNTVSIAIDPVTPSIVYAGSYGHILKTTSGGATWSALGGSGLPASDEEIYVVIDPQTPTTIYAGTSAGVVKSTNSGTNWAPTTLSELDVQALVIDPSDPDVLYAGGFGEDDATVYKTVDGGATWTPSPLPEVPNALAVLGPTTLLAGTNDVGVFKSTDAAASWVESNTGLVATAVVSLATSGAQAGKAYAGTWNKVHRTANGGDAWTPTTPFFTQGIASLAISDIPGTAYAGDAGAQGVFKTIDDGANWVSVSFNNMAPVNAYSLVLMPGSASDIYAGGIFVGVARGVFGPGSWTTLNNGLFPSVRALAMDQANPAILYAGTDPLGGSFQGVFKTVDAGGQWNPVNNGLPVGTMDTPVVGLAMDQSNTSVVYAAVQGAGVFKTTNAGTSWAAMNAGLGSLEVSSVAVDAIVANRVWVGTRDEGVFMTDDGGGSWVAANDGLVMHAVWSLAVEPGRVYAGTGGNGAFVMDVDVTTTTSTSTSTSTSSTTLPPALLGRALTIRDPKPGPTGDPSKRKIVVSAKEPAADETLNPFALIESGGSLTLTTFGANPSAQTWRLSPPLWTLIGTTGARYYDKLGVNGPVKSVVVKKSAAGTFEIKATILGKLGPGLQPHVFVVPPDPGVGAKMVFQVNGADTYCTGFGGAAGGQVTNNGAVSFKVTRPTAAVCP